MDKGNIPAEFKQGMTAATFWKNLFGIIRQGFIHIEKMAPGKAFSSLSMNFTNLKLQRNTIYEDQTTRPGRMFPWSSLKERSFTPWGISSQRQSTTPRTVKPPTNHPILAKSSQPAVKTHPPSLMIARYLKS